MIPKIKAEKANEIIKDSINLIKSEKYEFNCLEIYAKIINKPFSKYKGYTRLWLTEDKKLLIVVCYNKAKTMFLKVVIHENIHLLNIFAKMFIIQDDFEKIINVIADIIIHTYKTYESIFEKP